MHHRLQVECAAVLVTLISLLAGHAAADPPDILRNYRFIPGHSTVHVTGGFAGFNQSLTAAGTFGLITGYQQGFSCLAIGCPPPPYVPFAEFTDVKAILFNPLGMAPAPLPGWDLDDTLNLSGLGGTFTDPSRLHFRGVDGQGAPIKIDATISGRLIHLTGANSPPCCDFFNYKIDAYAHLAPFADFNFDGQVDRTDLGMLRTNLGLMSGASLEQGDADGDGDVDGGDYLAWQRDAGMIVDMSAFSDLGGGAGSVPEPGTLVLTFLGVLPWVLWRRVAG